MGKTSYKGKRVLVTGGGGFIGAALAKSLALEGATVFVTAREKAPWRLKGERNIRVITLDLGDAHSAMRAVKVSSPEIVFHTASTTEREQSLLHASRIIDGTFGVTENIALASSAQGVKKFIQFGTIEEYIGGEAPYHEDAPDAPSTSYSLGKVLATRFVLGLGKLSGMNVCVIRPAATFGPAQRDGMLIPNIIKSGLSKKDFSMNAGEQLRDFLYIDDLVQGVLLAGASPKTDGQIINFGSGKKTKVKTLVTMLNKSMKNPITIHFGVQPYRKGDSMLTLLDIKKAKKLLGWTPSTPLETALEKTVLWYTLNHKIAKDF